MTRNCSLDGSFPPIKNSIAIEHSIQIQIQIYSNRSRNKCTTFMGDTQFMFQLYNIPT